MPGVCVAFVAAAAAHPPKGLPRKDKPGRLPLNCRPAAGARFRCTRAAGRATQRAKVWRSGSACATSAIIFLIIASPNELKFCAASTNAPGPPMTLLR